LKIPTHECAGRALEQFFSFASTRPPSSAYKRILRMRSRYRRRCTRSIPR